MSTVVNAFCRNPRHKRPFAVGKYTFSAPDNVWVRTDDGGSDRDMWPVTDGAGNVVTDDGNMFWEPRPTFMCPCGRTNGNGYRQETIQRMVNEAVVSGERLWVL